MSNNQPLTTGQAAEYCHVSQATINNWIKTGRLKAYTTPGGHHRILLSDFISFLKTYDMPVDASLESLYRPHVLLVSKSKWTSDMLQILRSKERLDVTLVESNHEAGAEIARSYPIAIVVDMASDGLDCVALCRWLQEAVKESPPLILATGRPVDKERALQSGANAFVLCEAIDERLEAELTSLIELAQDSV